MVSPLQQALFEMSAPSVDDNCEWYTPNWVMAIARLTIAAEFDLDPASCAEANRVVRAKQFYAKEQDGLKQNWYGHVWLNPPYGRDVIDAFVEKLLHERKHAPVKTIWLLTDNRADAGWWQKAAAKSTAILFFPERIKFWGPLEKGSSPTQGQTLMLFGAEYHDRFYAHCRDYGFFASGGIWGAHRKNWFSPIRRVEVTGTPLGKPRPKAEPHDGDDGGALDPEDIPF